MSAITSSRGRFPLLFALALSVLLVLGFGPSFFFRVLTDRPELPLNLVVHGVAGTAWFALFLAQVFLAARRKTQWHRQLGLLGVVIALVFLVTGVQTTLEFTRKMVTQGDFVASNGSGPDFVHWAIAVSYGGLVLFAGILSAALIFRRRPDIHGRLMLLATAGLLGPAVSRVVGWFVALPDPLMAMTLVFLVAMLAQDIRTRGRPHIATVLGGLYSYGIMVAFIVADVGRHAMELAS